MLEKLVKNYSFRITEMNPDYLQNFLEKNDKSLGIPKIEYIRLDTDVHYSTGEITQDIKFHTLDTSHNDRTPIFKIENLQEQK